MENTKASPGPFDAFASAKPDEPIFTLQGGDPLAPTLVATWAKNARTMGVELSKSDNAVERSKGNALLIRATEAEAVSWAMLDYLDERVEEEAAPEVLPEVQTREQVNEHRERVAASRAVSNSVAECTQAAEVAARFELLTAARTLRTVADSLRVVSDELKGPYRG